MKTVHIQFSTDWQPRKLDMMLKDIVIDLSAQGAPNAKVWVEGEAPAEERVLNLECFSCVEGKAEKGGKRQHPTWASETFTACPKCGQRDSVRKVEQAAA